MHMVEKYVHASRLQYSEAGEVIEEFRKEISQMNGKCIDIGCGPGNVTNTLLLPKLAPEAELVGVDISKNMIEYASETYNNEKRLSFFCLDAETEDLPNDLVNQFNNVFSSFCLHWCQNPRRSFENIWKMLRPGGTALIMFLARGNGYDAYINLSKNPLYRPYMQDVDRFVPYYYRYKDPSSSLREHLKDTGFEILHCSRRQKDFVYENMPALKSHMEAINPFVNRLPEDLRDQFLEDIAQDIAKQNIICQQQNGCCNKEYKICDTHDMLVAYVRKPLHT